jgi:hypothetical protein
VCGGREFGRELEARDRESKEVGGRERGVGIVCRGQEKGKEGGKEENEVGVKEERKRKEGRKRSE